MANNIKGLTVEISGDTTKLGKALEDVNKSTRDITKELKQVENGLKFNPKSTELLNQKQKLLGEQVATTKEKLDKLKEAEKQVQAQFEKGDIGEEQYRAFQRELVETESKLKHYKGQLKEAEGASIAFAQKLEEAASKLKNIGGKLTDVGKSISTKVTLPIVGAGTVAFKFAADLEDAMGATDQIFKGSAGEVKAWADGLASYYGIAEGEALEYSNVMGAMLQNIGGLSEAEASKQSAMLVELAGDLSAMFGGTTESAVQALTGALKGNNSMLDNYGMGVNEATIKTKAMEMGLIKGKEQLDLAGKQAATLALIMEQTADAQGQAGREADGASGSMKSLGTEVKNIATNIGQILLPVITPLILKVKEMAEKFKELSPTQQENIVKIALLAAAIGPLIIIFGTLTTSLGSIIGLFAKMIPAIVGGTTATISAVAAKLSDVAVTATLTGLYIQDAIVKAASTVKTVAMTVAQTAWNGIAMAGAVAAKVLSSAVALMTGPFGLAVVAIAAIIAIGILLYKNWDTVKEKAKQLGAFVSGKFNELKSNVSIAWNNIKESISNAITGAKDKVSTVVNSIKSSVSNAFNSVKSGVSNTWNAIKTAITTPINAAKDAVGTAISKIKGFFSGLRLKFPKIEMPKLPKFSLEGKFSLMPPSVPKLKVNWNADGGIFTRPTIMPTMAGMQGFAEPRTGGEAIMPLNKLPSLMADAMALVGGNGSNIIIKEMIVREDADINRISRELYKLQNKKKRGGR